MPFQNRSQEEACWSQKEQAEKEGKTSDWNCEEWEHPNKKKKATDPYFDYTNTTQDIKKSIYEVDILIEKSISYLNDL